MTTAFVEERIVAATFSEGEITEDNTKEPDLTVELLIGITPNDELIYQVVITDLTRKRAECAGQYDDLFLAAQKYAQETGSFVWLSDFEEALAREVEV